jgi:hypothetical protein
MTPLEREAGHAQVSFRKADVEGFYIFYREAGPTDAQTLLHCMAFRAPSICSETSSRGLPIDFTLVGYYRRSEHDLRGISLPKTAAAGPRP